MKLPVFCASDVILWTDDLLRRGTYFEDVSKRNSSTASGPVTPRWRRVGLPVLIVLVGSVIVGALTSPAQQYLPDAVASFANSAGGWSMFAFLLVWLSRSRVVLGAVLGAIAFTLMVESYGEVSALRGYFFAAPFTSYWDAIGLVAGPILGAGAALVRHGSRRMAILSVAVLSSVMVSESLYGLTAIRSSTSPIYWSLQIAAAIGFLVAAFIRAGKHLRSLEDFGDSGTTSSTVQQGHS
jgi:Family of unknown function (DUF6518)